MKEEKLLTKKAVIIAICGTLIIGAIGLSLIQSQASSANKGINSEKATAIALENAGIKQDDAVKLISKYEYEDGKQVYEVGFYANNFEYDYLIAAADGVIIEAKREMMDAEDYKEAGLENPNTKKEVQKEPAKASSSQQVSQSEKPAETKQSTQPKQPAQTQQSSQASQDSSSSSYISTDKAKSIALNKAGVSASNATFTKAKLDRDDGVYVYEIEFISGSYEYDVEINATSGKVLDYDVDHIDD